MLRWFLVLSLLFTAVSFALAGEGGADAALPQYRLTVSFDISTSRLLGVAQMPVRAGERVYLHAGALSIQEVQVGDKAVSFKNTEGLLEILPPENGELTIKYEGSFPDMTASSWIDKDHIGKQGISLTGVWYPRISGLAYYHLTASLPRGYEAISEGESITKEERGDETVFSFDFPHPVNGLNFVAADRFEVTREEHKGIGLYAYFVPEDRELAREYIAYAKRYLDLYEGLIGAYPYKRFSIVENFLPSGFSMPTFTLLGQDVVRLPFIVETSLGHEILHQWFGNTVYVDYAKGNWAEGVTTYLADQLYAEQKGQGWEYRKQSLVDFMSYVTEETDFPLRDFRGRIDHASKAVGYGKGSMVFHMLRKLVGEEAFFAALRGFVQERGFTMASWKDLQDLFERASGKDLGGFFSQWLDQKGLPALYVEMKELLQTGKGFRFSFDITMRGAYTFEVPVTLYFAEGSLKHEKLALKEGKNSFTFILEDLPVKVAIDEDYDVARLLAPGEVPPVIAGLLGSEPLIVALPESGREVYQPVIDLFRARNAKIGEASDIKDSDIKSASVVILGADNSLAGRLFGKGIPAEAGFSVVMKENPWNVRKVVGIISSSSKAETEAAARKIPHYGKYSSLSFAMGKNTVKKINDSDRGMVMEAEGEPTAVATPRIQDLSEVIGAVADKRIVYVGEAHSDFSHHYVQLRVIKGLYEKDRNIAIGMEMFQRPFQPVLDAYLKGEMSEGGFLKQSEYFTRWGYDYNLYKPIIDFAKDKGIRIIALNTRREIIELVSRRGLDSLPEEERKELPPNMDFSDEAYRQRLKDVFDRHMGASQKNFDFFFQSQVLWDETMSFSVDEFLRENPDTQVIVLAGSGHLARGSGIPSRTFRRNGLSRSIILSDGDVEQEAADYLVFPRPIAGQTSPKLMALLKKEDGRMVVSGFPEKSIAEQAGMKEGDILLSLDDIPVKDIDDIRVHLLSKEKGDTVKVKVLRKRFLFGDAESEITISFP